MEPLEGVSTLERKLLHQASRTRIPINGSIELLPLCNMNCDMCYVRLTQSEMEQKGQLHSVSEWLNLAQQMQKSGVLFLLLTGGEPLLYPGFRELYVELQKLGMILTINTNGTLINEETASFLGSHKPRRVNITLYGADETAYRELCHYPGGFEKTIRGIRLLRKNDIDVKLSTSLTKANRSDIDRIISLGKELDIPVRTDTYMLPAVRERTQSHALNSRLEPYEAAEARIQALKSEMGADLFSQFVQQTLEKIDHFVPSTQDSKHVSCLAGKCSFTINWQGKMRPCVVMSEPECNVFLSGFDAAWNHIVQETDKILLSSKCSVCPMQSLCRTCAASALLETGDYLGVPDYMCAYTEESLRLLRAYSVSMASEASDIH